MLFFRNFEIAHFFDLAGGRCSPDLPVFGWGGKPLQTPPLKRSFVTFDRGGQTGPPRSNAFFSAPLTTRALPTIPGQEDFEIAPV